MSDILNCKLCGGYPSDYELHHYPNGEDLPVMISCCQVTVNGFGCKDIWNKLMQKDNDEKVKKLKYVADHIRARNEQLKALDVEIERLVMESSGIEEELRRFSEMDNGDIYDEITGG